MSGRTHKLTVSLGAFRKKENQELPDEPHSGERGGKNRGKVRNVVLLHSEL